MTPFPKRFIRKKKRGFALIATLTLMMLLTLLAVGILALASSQNRISLQTILQAEARQQALVGLDAAIGELQVELGPDRRVSANSGILNASGGSGSQYLLGVWNSWDGPLYGKSVSGKGSSIRETYDKGRSKMFRRWLISSRRPGDTRQVDGADKLTSRRPGERICLVGEGTLGTEYTARHYVYADLLTMPSVGNNKSCFAWWIGAENQKAKVTVADPEDTEEAIEVLHRTWNTPGPMFVNSESLSFLPEKIEQPDKIVTLGTLPLVASASQSPGTPWFFDVTTTSYTLPVNVRTGGLKQDLNLLLNKKNLKGTEFAARSSQDCPIAEGEDVPQGTEHLMPIGSWQNLHAYYHCWPDGTADDSKNFTARLIGDVNNAYTRMGGSLFDERGEHLPDSNVNAGSMNFFDTRSLLENGYDSAGYARNPVMLAYMGHYALWTQEREGFTFSDVPEAKGYYVALGFSPMFLWWNPYNVPMKIRGGSLWSLSSPSRTTWLQTCGPVAKNTSRGFVDSQTGWTYVWSRYGVSNAIQTNHGAADYGSSFGEDYGDYFQNTVQDKTGDIVFEPGEILFFSPGKRRREVTNTNEKLEPASVPFILGYHPGNVAGYTARFFTPWQSSAKGYLVSSDFNLDGGAEFGGDGIPKFHLTLRLGLTGCDEYRTLDIDRLLKDDDAPSGYFFAPNKPTAESLTVVNGFGGMTPKESSDALEGKYGISPQSMVLGWYDPNKPDVDTTVSERVNWTAQGVQSDPNLPYYISIVGIVPKSAVASMDGALYPNKDFRTKLWQHSSPALYGSVMVSPDDQQRQYHPFQLAVVKSGGAGASLSPMDSIGNNGMLGVTSDGEQVSFASVLELPVHPPFSLAGFAGMRLQPGWFNHGTATDETSILGTSRRARYQNGVPGVGIGNSFADPCIPADDVYKLHTSKVSTSLNKYARLFDNFYDHGLLINDALWDRWFCSSISDMPAKGGKKKEAREVLENFLSGKEELPVARYRKANAAISNADVVSRIMDGDGWKRIAQYLMIDGGFNVNSTSEEAWAAVLQGLAKRKLVTNVGKQLSLVEENKDKDQVLFSRFMVSTTGKSVDSLGGYSMLQGSGSFRRDAGMTSAWGEVRMLEPEQIRELARKMVKQVRERGPFLNMSDFINRRLESGSKHALKGALQAAIDATDINADFQEVQAARGNQGSLFVHPEAEEGSIYTAAPGYLIQSDVLASLGNILTVRDDTFTVRAYGCVKSATNAILAQAWCEAVVQRTMDYVDPSNSPEDTDYEPDGSKAKGLTRANKVMGRRFRVVSFKWLDAWDI